MAILSTCLGKNFLFCISALRCFVDILLSFFSIFSAAMEKKNNYEDGETRIYDDASKMIRSHLLLPFDLAVDEILTRVPVKSLARFRCVSKLWLHLLTSDPNFAMRQHQLRQESSSLTLISSRIQAETGTVNIHDIDTTVIVVKGKHNPPPPPPLSFGELVDCTAVSNSVNGLVACGYETIHRTRPFSCHYLLNPSTRELVQLPPTSRDDRWGILGFGYSSEECCYKLVRLFSAAASSRIRFCKCEVLTIGTSNWRYLGEAPTALPFGQPVFLNGSIHWMALAPADDDDSDTIAAIVILTFGVKDDKFRLMPVPEQAHPQHIGLGDYGGRLCVTVLHEPSSWNIWVLDDCSKQQIQWTKLHVISTVLPDKRLISYPRLIGIKDGKLLLQNVANHCFQPVYSYDPRTNAFSLVLLPNQASPHLRFYGESLISPASLLNLT